MKFLQLNFIPSSTDLGLLLIRVWAGASMAILHGWVKLANFSGFLGKLPDPLGVGPTVNLGLVVAAEFVCALCIALGLFTRLSALVLGVTMAVAFKLGHGMKLSGDGNGELAFLYLGACVTLLVAGAGKFSLDAKLGGKA